MQPSMRVICALFTLILCWHARSAQGQGTEPPSTPNSGRKLQMSKMAQSYEIKFASDDSVKLKLIDRPIFNWVNPVRQADGGVIYLWTHHGRPTATMGIWTTSRGGTTNGYEFQSLAEDSLVATSDRLDKWRPANAGAKFERLMDDQIPSSDPRHCLRQMKSIAERHFTATLDPDTPNQEKLRLLPSPLFRYTEKPEYVVDGAIFAFAQDTGPEVLLILEARNSDNSYAWHYAVAPSTSHGIEATCDDKQIVRTTRTLTHSADDHSPFMIRFFDDTFFDSFK